MIQELRSDYPLAVLCRVLSVSRSGYHAWSTRQPSKRALSRERLCVAAQAAHGRTRATYGAVRLQQELAADGFAASLGTIKQVRRELGLRCVRSLISGSGLSTDAGRHGRTMTRRAIWKSCATRVRCWCRRRQQPGHERMILLDTTTSDGLLACA